VSHSRESNGAMNATEAAAPGRLQLRDLFRDDEPLAAHPLDLDGHERAELDELLVQRPADVRVGDARERPAGAACAEQAVGAVAGELLVPELLALGHVLREQLGREQPLDDVVVADVGRRAARARSRRRRCTPRGPSALRSRAARTSPSSGRSRARSRPRRAAHPSGGARAPAPRRPRCPPGLRRGTAGPCGPRSRGTRETRSPG
jgi:hypothetical protein